MREKWRDFINLENQPRDLLFSVPFISILIQKFQPEQILLIQGRVKEGAQRFQVDLHGSNGSIAFHFDTRFYENRQVMNSFLNGRWGKKNRIPIVFKRGQYFTLLIRALNNEFQIFVNHTEIHQFKHRIPVNAIEYLNVSCVLIITINEMLHFQDSRRYYFKQRSLDRTIFYFAF